jgi:hypothetical protein
MYAFTLTKADHTRRFTITDAGDEGWEVRDEEDTRVVRRVLYTDWHRVERARMTFDQEASSLAAAGWTAVGYSSTNR